MPEKTKVHTVYKNAEGKRLPSVTTVLGILDKPALINWAWKCGLDGLDYKNVRDNAADIGTLAHKMIMCHLTHTECDTSEYSPDDVSKAENSFIKYLEWEMENPIEPVLVEKPLVSDEYGYGGTIDCLAKLNGDLVLIDHKTGKAIYTDMFYQLSAYEQLLKENGYAIINSRILRIGRDETEGFEQRIMKDLSKHFELFKNCLSIYNLKKEIGR